MVGSGAFSDDLLSEGVAMKTLYDLLGVARDADDEALNKAYRKAAKAHHPDLNAGDPNASRRFRQITTAIEILRDAKERAAYDRLLEHERQQRRLGRTRFIMAHIFAPAVVIVVLATGYAPIESAFSTSTIAASTIAASTMVSEAEDNAVPWPVATGEEQGTPRVGPASGGVERGRLEQGLAVEAMSQQLAAAEREAGLVGEPKGRQNEAAARTEQDERPQIAELERPLAEDDATLRSEQTCKRGNLGCGRNRPASVTLRKEPKARPSAAISEAPRSTPLARRAAAPAPSQAAPNLLQRAGAGISGILQHCLL